MNIHVCLVFFLTCLVLSVPSSTSLFRWLLLTVTSVTWKIINYFLYLLILIIASTKALESVAVAARHLRLQKYGERSRELSLVFSRLSSACFTLAVSELLYKQMCSTVQPEPKKVVVWPLTQSRGRLQTASCTPLWCPSGPPLSGWPGPWSGWTQWFQLPGHNHDWAKKQMQKKKSVIALLKRFYQICFGDRCTWWETTISGGYQGNKQEFSSCKCRNVVELWGSAVINRCMLPSSVVEPCGGLTCFSTPLALKACNKRVCGFSSADTSFGRSRARSFTRRWQSAGANARFTFIALKSLSAKYAGTLFTHFTRRKGKRWAFSLKCAGSPQSRVWEAVRRFLTDGHQELLQVSRHLALDALLQSLLTHVLVLHQSCKHTPEDLYLHNNNEWIGGFFFLKYPLCRSWGTLLWHKMSINLASSVPHFFSPASYSSWRKTTVTFSLNLCQLSQKQRPRRKPRVRQRGDWPWLLP